MKKLLFFFVTLIHPLKAFAEEKLDLENTDNLILNENTDSMGSLFFRYIIVVAFVIVLLYFSLKIIVKKTKPTFDETSWANVLDYKPMGSNKGVYLLDIENEGYVILSSENNASLLTRIEKEKFDEIKKDIIVKNQVESFNVNPFKTKEEKSFHKYLSQNLKIAEKYLTKKRD